MLTDKQTNKGKQTDMLIAMLHCPTGSREITITRFRKHSKQKQLAHETITHFKKCHCVHEMLTRWLLSLREQQITIKLQLTKMKALKITHKNFRTALGIFIH